MHDTQIRNILDNLDPGLRALVAGHKRAALASMSGGVEILEIGDAAAMAADGGLLAVCHKPATAHRLGIARIAALDLLELFAFACPGQFCHPTPSGLAEALDLDPPVSIEEESRVLLAAVQELLSRLRVHRNQQEGIRIAEIARVMGMASWSWTPLVLRALDAEDLSLEDLAPENAMHAWLRLSEWSEDGPPREPAIEPVTAADARRRLARLVGRNSEDRPQQGDYTSAVSGAFAASQRERYPRVVLVEAGTGIGKTYGYLAPATVWAERNQQAVWISTFTRNLQRQIDRELDRLYEDPELKRRKVVIRKGRENYLCLLNFREAIREIGTNSAVALGLMARWIETTRDGDMEGGDFPGWLVDLVGTRHTTQLTDRRGECIYSACDHYRRCFVEKNIRRAHGADIVIANHALTLSQSNLDERNAPDHMVFDEGHHLFDTSDKAFAVLLSGREFATLRQWLLGSENRRVGRSNGLRHRMTDLLALDEGIGKDLENVAKGALILPAPGWERRVEASRGQNATELFLQELRNHIYSRAANSNSFYDLEITAADPPPRLVELANQLHKNLEELINPMNRLANTLARVLQQHKNILESSARNRIEGIARTLERRVRDELTVWRQMLIGIPEETPDEFVEWFAVTKSRGREIDVGMHRHWIDPMKPFTESVVEPAQGIVITSATLRDGTGDPEADWRSAEHRTGTIHLDRPGIRAQVSSPFDYPAQTRVLVVTDVYRDDLDEVADAYRRLFTAADGGALGLFTAITRLRSVHGKLAPAMEEAGYPLLAQHVDKMNITSLISVFRAEESSCLLGTDAMRDGVDVPGRSLRLIVFDRLPWPPRTILHRARSRAYSGGNYDDLIIRLRLRQAFGRLVRRASDCGVFVMLDPRMATRHAGAFPEGVEIERIPLLQAVEITRTFLAEAHQEA